MDVSIKNEFAFFLLSTPIAFPNINVEFRYVVGMFFSSFTPLLQMMQTIEDVGKKVYGWVSQKEMESRVNDSAEKAKLNLPNCPKTI